MTRADGLLRRTRGRGLRSLRALRHPRRDEAGAAALIISMLVPTVFLGCAAIGVDTAQWYLEQQRVQKAADAAALAGVPFLPQNFDGARERALEVAARNGYDDDSPDVEVVVEQGELASILNVTISSDVRNSFGAAIGVRSTTIRAFASADYQGPAPMGSPCNTFGNEPSAGGGTSSPSPKGTARGSNPFANCSSNPQFWAMVEGPEVDKVQGDRYQTRPCSSSSTNRFRCADGKNSEYDPNGYFFTVKVADAAVGTPITIQLYDPAYVYTGQTCEKLPTRDLSNNMNPYVGNDAAARYGRGDNTSSTGASYCTGDANLASDNNLMTTSFALREQSDTQNPRKAPIAKDTTGQDCVKQYTGVTSAPSATSLREKVLDRWGREESNSSYNPQLAQVFHNWTPLCTFTPAREGDYYLQVQTGVKAAGSSGDNNGKNKIIYSGNPVVGSGVTDTTSGTGGNGFGIRAVTQTGLERSVAVSGYDRMPIYANADSASSTFNLIRVLPGAAGQYVSFSFFDAADASEASGGTVKVTRPTDATGSILTTPFPGGCRSIGGYAGSSEVTLANCSAPVNNDKNNGALQTITIPIPTDYDCDYTSMGGCWYQVTVSFPGAKVHDTTTWDASVVGDPVRLIE